MTARLRVFVVALLLVTACGGGDSGVSRSAGTRLDAQVDEIRAAATDADRSATARQLEELLVVVGELQAKGELSADAAARIRRAAAAVTAQLSRLPAPTTTTTTTDPPPDDDKGKGKGNGKGRGQGNDRNDDDGDD